MVPTEIVIGGSSSVDMVVAIDEESVVIGEAVDLVVVEISVVIGGAVVIEISVVTGGAVDIEISVVTGGAVVIEMSVVIGRAVDLVVAEISVVIGGDVVVGMSVGTVVVVLVGGASVTLIRHPRLRWEAHCCVCVCKN